jgi:hypothetical protein
MSLFACFIAILSSSFALAAGPKMLSPSYELVLVDKRWPDRPFVIDVPAENERGIKSLESYIGGGVALDHDGSISIGVANGVAVRTEKSERHKWSFRIDPKTVEFADATIELCDASFMHIEEDIDKWLSEVGRFCPWSTALYLVSIKKTWTKK